MVFGTTQARTRRRSVVGLMALIWLALPSALFAFECKALDSNGLTRNCTALEELGECMAAAEDSRRQCVASSNLWGWWRCQEDAAIDMTVCVLVSPFRIIVK